MATYYSKQKPVEAKQWDPANAQDMVLWLLDQGVAFTVTTPDTETAEGSTAPAHELRVDTDNAMQAKVTPGSWVVVCGVDGVQVMTDAAFADAYDLPEQV